MNTKEWALLLFFSLLQVYLYSKSVHLGSFTEAADSSQYFYPAKSLLESFSLLDSGGKIFTIGTPLYSIIISPFVYFLEIENALFAIMTFQSFLLILIAFQVFKILEICKVRIPLIIVLSLMLFNPNSLITSHLVQSETLFTLILITSIKYSFLAFRYKKNKDFLLLGFVLGLLTLTRPAGFYFSILIPFILLFLSCLVYKNCKIFNLYKVLVLVTVFILTISPCIYRNYVNFGEFFISANSGYYLRDQYIQLVRVGKNLKQDEAITYVNNNLLENLKNISIDKECYEFSRKYLCNEPITSASLRGIYNENISTHLKAITYSVLNLFFTGGASNYSNYLGLNNKSNFLNMIENDDYSYLSFLREIVKSMNSYTVIFIIFTSFSVMFKLFSFLGFIYSLKKHDLRPYAILLISYMAIFIAMYLYLGQSRFRVPLEPIFLILFGFYYALRKNNE